jgi:hypothetical protein
MAARDWLVLLLGGVYFVSTALSIFGCCHLALMMVDARTRDLLTNQAHNPHSCAYRRGCVPLLSAWRRQWCGPVRWRWLQNDSVGEQVDAECQRLHEHDAAAVAADASDTCREELLP